MSDAWWPWTPEQNAVYMRLRAEGWTSPDAMDVADAHR